MTLITPWKILESTIKKIINSAVVWESWNPAWSQTCLSPSLGVGLFSFSRPFLTLAFAVAPFYPFGHSRLFLTLSRSSLLFVSQGLPSLSIPSLSLTLFLYVSVLLFCFGCWVSNLEPLFISLETSSFTIFALSSVTSSWSEILLSICSEIWNLFFDLFWCNRPSERALKEPQCDLNSALKDPW